MDGKTVKRESTTWSAKHWGQTRKHVLVMQQWRTLKCANILSLYRTEKLGYDNALPEDVHQSEVTVQDQRQHFEMTRAVMEHLALAGVRFSLAFGTLLSIVRYGTVVLPCDDYVDFLVDDRERDFKKITKGLQQLSKKAGKGPRAGLKGSWELPGGWVLYYKTRGYRRRFTPRGCVIP